MTRKKSGRAPRTMRGKPLNAYVRNEDVVKMRTLGAWLTTQGATHRVSDSQVIRTALRLAKTGPMLLKAFLEVAATDARRK